MDVVCGAYDGDADFFVGVQTCNKMCKMEVRNNFEMCK